MFFSFFIEKLLFSRSVDFSCRKIRCLEKKYSFLADDPDVEIIDEVKFVFLKFVT